MEPIDDIEVKRKVYTNKSFDERFRKNERDTPEMENESIFKKLIRVLNPLKLFTIFTFITEYDFKDSFVNDLISGITVGIMHIPQGLAYGSLTSLSPIIGLYTSFFPGLFYILFATSKHLSVGTFAIISLMVYSTINKFESEYFNGKDIIQFAMNASDALNETASKTSVTMDDVFAYRIRVSMSLAFLTGVFQVIFSILQVGSVSRYLSSALLSGFTTAAAVQVVTTQLPHILGIYIKNKKQHKYLQVFYTYYDLIVNYSKFNLTAFIISFIAITTLIVVRIHINERFKKQMRSIPIPTELIVLIAGTCITYFARLDTNYKLSVVGVIPTGLPKPTVPDFSIMLSLVPDAILIAILSFANSISAADLYAKKFKYPLNPNKEFLALGTANIFSSFFQCFCCSGALARTALLVSSGGKSQVVTMIASIVVLSVLLWIAPIFQLLPKACLGSIIIASLVNLLKQVTELPHYWKIDKLDVITWLVAFFSVICINIDLGLLISFIVVLFLNTYRSQKLKVTILGRIPDTDIFREINDYSCEEIKSVKILHVNDSVFYINAASLKNQCLKLVKLSTKESKNNCCNQLKSKRKDEEVELETEKLRSNDNDTSKNTIKFLILDFVDVNHIDETSIQVIRELKKDYKDEGTELLIANCNQSVIKKMKRIGCFEDDFDKITFLTIQDAVIHTKA